MQDSQRVSSHASSPQSSPTKQIIKAVDELAIKLEEAIMKGPTKIESLAACLAESHKAMCETHKSMCEAMKAAEAKRHADLEKLHEKLLAAEAQRHADSEKLLAAIANNYAPGASSDA